MSAAAAAPRLRIAFLSWRDLAHPQAGGSEVLIDRLATGCLERGHEVTLLCGGPVARRPYPVIDLGGEFSQYLRAPGRFHRRAGAVDVIVDVQNGIPFFSPLWTRTPTVCFVHHVHGAQWRQRFGPTVARIGWGLERYGMPLVYRRRSFVTISDSSAGSLREIGVPPERTETLVQGIDLPDAPIAARSAEPRFLALGRLVPHKRIDLLLRAWERVRPHTGGRLVIAGTGPELPRLKRLAGVDVEFLGAVTETRKAELLDSAWLFVHPAMHEGWGIVIIEAAAHGLPAIGFDVSGVRDAIQDGHTGELVSDEDGLVERWIALAGDPRRRAELGAAARTRAGALSWANTHERFDLLLNRVAAATGPAAAA